MFSSCVDRLDKAVRMNLAQFSLNRWLSIRLEFLGGLLVFASAVFVVVGKTFSPEMSLGLRSVMPYS